MVDNKETLQKLDALLVAIDRCSPAEEAEFAHEHVLEARTYLLGAMLFECDCNLELAEETLARMDDTASRRSAQSILSNLKNWPRFALGNSLCRRPGRERT